jgi:hypothetical protein
MRTGVIIVALCAVSYGDPAVFRHDDVSASGELSPEERSSAGDICFVYCGPGDPLFESMALTADTLEMDITVTPLGNRADILHCVWLWNGGEFSLLEASDE